MKTFFSKGPFSDRTLSKIVEHIYLQLGTTCKIIYRIKDHPTFFLGYFSTVAKKLKQLLKEKDPRNGRIALQINSFKLDAKISEFFNQLLLNMKQLIKWQNIDKFKVQVKKNLGYVAVLRKICDAVGSMQRLFRYLPKKKTYTKKRGFRSSWFGSKINTTHLTGSIVLSTLLTISRI